MKSLFLTLRTSTRWTTVFSIWIVIISLQVACNKIDPETPVFTKTEESLQVVPPHPVRDFQIIDEREALILTVAGKLIRINGDKSSIRETTAPINARQLFFLNDNIGWVMDREGQIWSTSDQGQSWSKRGKLGHGNSTKQLTFISEKTGWLVEAFSIWLTEDGGYTWQKVYPNEQTLIDNVNALPISYFPATTDVAWLGMSDGKILKSRNRGKSWVNVSLLEKLDIRSIFAIGDSKCWIGTAGAGSGLFGTLNGGVSWQRVFVDGVSVDYAINSMSFIEHTGWAAGRFYVTDVNSPEKNTKLLLRTNDGGESWTQVELKLDEEELKIIKFRDREKGWLIGNSKIYFTNNGGTSWNAAFRIADLENSN